MAADAAGMCGHWTSPKKLLDDILLDFDKFSLFSELSAEIAAALFTAF